MMPLFVYDKQNKGVLLLLRQSCTLASQSSVIFYMHEEHGNNNGLRSLLSGRSRVKMKVL